MQWLLVSEKQTSKFNKIYRIFQKTFLPALKDAFAEQYTNFYNKRGSLN
jgi:hypothetical protein